MSKIEPLPPKVVTRTFTFGRLFERPPRRLPFGAIFDCLRKTVRKGCSSNGVLSQRKNKGIELPIPEHNFYGKPYYTPYGRYLFYYIFMLARSCTFERWPRRYCLAAFMVFYCGGFDTKVLPPPPPCRFKLNRKVVFESYFDDYPSKTPSALNDFVPPLKWGFTIIRYFIPFETQTKRDSPQILPTAFRNSIEVGHYPVKHFFLNFNVLVF